MTTTNRNRPTTMNSAGRTWTKLAQYSLAGMLIGAAPGVLLVLLAEFVVDGEMQLTVGAPGLLLTAIGAVVGLIVGSQRARGDRIGRDDAS